MECTVDIEAFRYLKSFNEGRRKKGDFLLLATDREQGFESTALFKDFSSTSFRMGSESPSKFILLPSSLFFLPSWWLAQPLKAIALGTGFRAKAVRSALIAPVVGRDSEGASFGVGRGKRKSFQKQKVVF